VNLEEVEELFKAFNEAGISLGFGRDACTNIPNPYDPDDTDWHLMHYDESLYERREKTFKRILEE
jgi:hypothetical protein